MSSSPNLPKFSPSSIGVYNECPVKWELSYIDGLKRMTTAKHFELGTYWHEHMHHLYRAIQAGMDRGSQALYALMESRIRADLTGLTPENAAIMNTVFKMTRDYILRYQETLDAPISSIYGVEHKVSIQVRTPKGHEVILEGIADLIYYKNTGKIWIRDHKSGAKNTYSNEALQIMFQLLFYYAVLAQQGLPIEGIQISYANSHDYKDRSKQPLSKLFNKYEYSPPAAQVQGLWEYLLKRIDTILEDTPQPSYGQQCSSCPFRQVCVMRMSGQDPHYYILGQYARAKRDYVIPVTWRESNEPKRIEDAAELPEIESTDFQSGGLSF